MEIVRVTGYNYAGDFIDHNAIRIGELFYYFELAENGTVFRRDLTKNFDVKSLCLIGKTSKTSEEIMQYGHSTFVHATSDGQRLQALNQLLYFMDNTATLPIQFSALSFVRKQKESGRKSCCCMM